MVEIALAALVGLLVGLFLGAFLLVHWVNRYTSRQVTNAHVALDKLKVLAQELQKAQSQNSTSVN